MRTTPRLPPPPNSPWRDLAEAFAAQAQVTAAPVSESRLIEKATVPCPPRRLWTMPPVVNERAEWMRAMARGESQFPTMKPEAK